MWVTEWCARKKDTSPGMINSATEYGVAMHEAFQGGANVFMAYDWVYPPRDSGEALIHVDWGKDYTLTKPYYLFRQWAEPLKPGMHVVEVGVSGRPAAGVRATAFLAADGRTLVVHVVNAQDQGGRRDQAHRQIRGRDPAAPDPDEREEDAAALPEVKGTGGTFPDTLPARSMVTYRVAAPGK